MSEVTRMNVVFLPHPVFDFMVRCTPQVLSLLSLCDVIRISSLIDHMTMYQHLPAFVFVGCRLDPSSPIPPCFVWYARRGRF